MAKEKDYLSMSDDEFLQLAEPEEVEGEEANESEQEVQREAKETLPAEAAEESSNSSEEERETNDSGNESEPEPVKEKEVSKNIEVDDKSATIQNNKTDNTPSINYEEFYQKIMAPFKANGTMIKLNNPEEVISLMQKGANYTKKTQELSRYKKTGYLLERANLLNEARVGLLIDAAQGNKEAIKQILRDNKIDPMSLVDDSIEENQPRYVSNTRISDADIDLQETVNDISSNPGGKEFLDQTLKFDHETQLILSTKPHLLSVLYSHTQNKDNTGHSIYDYISSEINRRKTIGIMPDSMPFIQAYDVIATEIRQRSSQRNQVNNGSAGVNFANNSGLSNKPNLSQKFSNNSKAKSASLTRTTGSDTSSKPINYLAMSDEEFIKRFGTR